MPVPPRALGELLLLVLQRVRARFGMLLAAALLLDGVWWLLFLPLRWVLLLLVPASMPASLPADFRPPWEMYFRTQVLFMLLPPPVLSGISVLLARHEGHVWGVLRAAAPRLGTLLGLGLMVCTADLLLLTAPTFCGALFLGTGWQWLVEVPCAVLSAWLLVRWYLAAPVLVAEGLGPTASLRRSWQLSAGLFWRILALGCCLGLPQVLVTLPEVFLAWPSRLWAQPAVWIVHAVLSVPIAVGAVVMHEEAVRRHAASDPGATPAG